MSSCHRFTTRPLLLLLALAILTVAPAAVAQGGGLREMLGLAPSPTPFLRADEAFTVTMERRVDGGAQARWTIASGYYLYRGQIEVYLDGRDLVAAGQVTIPRGEPKNDPEFGQTEVFHETLTVHIAPPLEGSRLVLGYQGCADGGVCYPPMVQTFELASLPVAEIDAETAAAPPPWFNWQDNPAELARLLEIGGWWTNLLTFYGLGLLLAFTPCNLPMIPIVSALVAGQPGKRSTGRAFALSLIYVLSVSITYAAAGVLTALLGANLQASFQNPLVLWSFAGIFALLGLAMFGLYELQMPSFIQSRIDMWVRRVRGGTLAGTAAMGLLSALIIGPCVAAPLVGALIYIGQSGDVWLGGTALFVLSLGMGTPLLLVGTSAGVLVPRAGPWMLYVQHLFGLMLLAVALWIVNRLVPPALALLLWGGWLIIVGVWLGALNPARTPARRIGQGLAVVVVVYGALLMSGGASGGDRFWLPLGHLRGGAATVVHVPFKPIKTVPDLERELEGARARGQTVMLDFYADWCVDCVIMARTTFSDPRVVESLQPVLTLQADVTANDEADRALMAHLGVIGPPTILFFDASGRELRNDRVVGLLKPEPFLRHLEQVWTTTEERS
ncbi:MAG TPA: protein-disulfide reductase DsbD [Candidatus Macondimonas sp.]|nr:protein-disulfide reductase DsbD [Candidatus Macondimonas sp.]